MQDAAPASPAPSPALTEEEQPSLLHHKAAKYAVIALGVAFVINVSGQLSSAGGTSVVTRVISLLGGLLFLSAIPAGVIALCGIPKHGCRYLLWRGLVGILVPVLLIGMAIPAFLKVRSLAAHAYVQNAATTLNKDAPKMIDEITRLDKAVAGPGNRLTVDVTIVTFKAADIDREVWNTQVLPNLKKGILGSPLAAVLQQQAGTLTYRYFGSDGVKIDELSLTAADVVKK